MIKDLVNRIINEKKWFIKEINGIKIFATDHSLEREMERNDLTPDDFFLLLKKIVNEINSDENYDDGTYLFFSKSLNQGVILELKNNRKRINIITYLPRGKQNAKSGTKKVVIESYKDLAENYFNELKDYFWIDKVKENMKYGEDYLFDIDVTILG